MDAAEFSVDETHGFAKLDGFDICKTSAGLCWSSAYMSVQSAAPYVGDFKGRDAVLISVLDAGSIRADVRTSEGTRHLRCLPGTVSVIPDKMPFHADLQTSIRTTHLYLRRAVLDEVASGMVRGDPAQIEFVVRMGVCGSLLLQLCHAVRGALYQDPKTSGFYVEHMAQALAAQLIRRHSNADMERRKVASTGGLSAREFTRTCEMIEASLDKRLTKSGLAADTGFGSEHFGRLFKQTAGITLHQFVIERRVDRARGLLTNTTMPIADIAHECGFVDQVHLTRVFGRVVGITPAAFRKAG